MGWLLSTNLASGVSKGNLFLTFSFSSGGAEGLGKAAVRFSSARFTSFLGAVLGEGEEGGTCFRSSFIGSPIEMGSTFLASTGGEMGWDRSSCIGSTATGGAGFLASPLGGIVFTGSLAGGRGNN